MLNPFRVVSPTTVAEASSELERLGDQAVVYAGGAELLLLMRHGLLEPDYLVNIKPIGLDAVAWDGQAVRIGATVLQALEVHRPGPSICGDYCGDSTHASLSFVRIVAATNQALRAGVRAWARPAGEGARRRG